MDDQTALDLIAVAESAAANAYAPYSRFRVGAVAVAEDGSRFTGVNVENAAYGSTLCAEAAAVAAAVSAGHRRLETIAVTCPDGDECFPCGNCRQLMVEFGVENVIVGAPGHATVHRMADLMPRSFGPGDLPGPA